MRPLIIISFVILCCFFVTKLILLRWSPNIQDLYFLHLHNFFMHHLKFSKYYFSFRKSDFQILHFENFVSEQNFQNNLDHDFRKKNSKTWNVFWNKFSRIKPMKCLPECFSKEYISEKSFRSSFSFTLFFLSSLLPLQRQCSGRNNNSDNMMWYKRIYLLFR